MKIAVRLLPPLRSYLWLKLVLSLAAVVMISSLLTVLLVRRSLDSGMRLMLSKEDSAWADELAEAASAYLQQGGTIEEFSQQIGAVPPGRTYLRRWPERSPGSMPGMMSPMMRRAMNVPPLAITDNSGNILFHTIEGREVRELGALAVQQGSPIRGVDGISAYVFAGSLLQPGLAPLQLEFLQNVTRAAIMSALLGLLVAVLLGSILFTNIMSPLRALLQATSRVAAGRFDTRLDEERKDELGQLSHGFNTMLASLAEADAWKRRLIADAAHELRTPVGLIQTRLEMMQDGVYPMDQENIGILHGNIMLMSRLLHDLQELSSAEAGTSRIEYSTLAVDELARGVLDDFRGAAAERRLQLAFVQDPALEQPCLIDADRQLLLRILNNLLSNALTAGNPGGYVRLELRRVQLSPGKVSDGIELLCVDNGAGIPETEREKIFERFYRIDSSRNRQSGGSGLGLAISRELARLHGGSLSAEANPEGQGSLFRLVLPRKHSQT